MTALARVRAAAAVDSRTAAAADSRKVVWLISFTDLISLLLAFFVLMYSMTEPDPARWASFREGLSARSTATTPSDAAPVPRAPFNAAVVDPQAGRDLDYLAALLRRQARGHPDLKGATVRREDDRVVIGLPAEILFANNGFAFTEEGRRALFVLGDALGRLGERIEIVGRAERESAAGDRQWERALARAVAVAGILRETGYRRDLVARAAFAPTAARFAARPRVDIVVRGEKDWR